MAINWYVLFNERAVSPILMPHSVLRSQNLGMLRPERSWRPIITLEVDGQHKHEVMLGTDGQNPNQREIMLLCVALPRHLVNDPDLHSHHAHHQTCIKLDVWHKPQSKAKSRRHRRHVASAVMPLGEVVKKQGTNPCAPSPLFSMCHTHPNLQTWSFACPVSLLHEKSL